ncbi:hypothetical protein SCLCIDRAFT_17748 [Scleroderma citrinum Foug A]|uniref:Endonuclease/exonuclease/phosphatase domain-containing protein n=1 Tax=Scleroderma citrinum Foug A TaxID=1036808 RepID=A0A0C3DCX4_9AGAM|nr:hypothetical protein SCLCIDRAFT_17748 [Scleroderma citrinum Foug A]
MKGHTSQLTGTGPISKWSAISKTMRENKIGLLALQETHLSDQLAEQASNLYQRRLSITNSPHPNNLTGSAGIAFVINKELVKAEDVITHVLIPGRVMYILLKWHHTSTLNAINKWADLHLPKPDLLLGDFNLTEDLIDRAPARHKNDRAVTALRECRQALKCAFTFTTHGHTMSRIDRIYAKEDLEDNLIDWTHDAPGIPTNHKMVTVRLALTNSPLIGKDRWSWPLGLLHDKELNKYINQKGQQLHTEMKNLPPNDRTINAQTLWQTFKDDIKREAVKAAKKQIPKITQ